MEFTRVEYGYDGVQNDVRTYIMAGADSYDLIVNDLYGLTGLTVEGMFHSADKGEYFDFTLVKPDNCCIYLHSTI